MDTTATSRRRISAPSHHRQRKAHAISLLPMPPAPPEMSAVAAAEWVRIGARAIVIGVLPDIDRSIFAAYCNAVGDLADVRSAWTLEGRPATVMRPSGQRPHPSLETLRQLSADVLKYASALGLTPKSRKGLGIEIGVVAEPVAASARRKHADPAARFFSD